MSALKKQSSLSSLYPQSRKESPTARQLSNYHEIIADETLKPARLCWVERKGEMVKCAWSEMTVTEKIFQNEADRRAYELAMFNPCDWEGVN